MCKKKNTERETEKERSSSTTPLNFAPLFLPLQFLFFHLFLLRVWGRERERAQNPSFFYCCLFCRSRSASRQAGCTNSSARRRIESRGSRARYFQSLPSPWRLSVGVSVCVCVCVCEREGGRAQTDTHLFSLELKYPCRWHMAFYRLFDKSRQ